MLYQQSEVVADHEVTTPAGRANAERTIAEVQLRIISPLAAVMEVTGDDRVVPVHWQDDNDVHSAFSARAFSGLILQTLNWKMNCRYQCRGICRGQGNAKFLIFELDESRILTGKNQYEQENCSMNLKCRLYRSKWVQSITVSDVMESGQVVENPMIGAIPSRNEVQRELDDLLMSM